jgi:hypothetical protein
MKVGFLTATEERVKLFLRQHFNVLVGGRFAACVAILDNSVTPSLHHFGESQDFSSKSAVAVLLRGLSVKKSEKVKSGFHEWGSSYLSLELAMRK